MGNHVLMVIHAFKAGRETSLPIKTCMEPQPLLCLLAVIERTGRACDARAARSAA